MFNTIIKNKICSSKKRLGRGSSSDKGNTSGRGTKGQLSRSGVSLLGFEGGQTAFYKRLPKRGFKKIKNKIHLFNTKNINIKECINTKKNTKFLANKVIQNLTVEIDDFSRKTL